AVWPAGDQPAGPALGDQKALFAQAKSHWAFQPAHKPAVPELPNAAWVRTPIDAFVLEKLRAAGLRPSLPADPRTLIRRLYFDLIGLPPTAAAVHDFAQKAAAGGAAFDEAYAELVDKLLASQHYVE